MKKVMALVIACIMAIGVFSISVAAADSKLPGGHFFFKNAVKDSSTGINYKIGNTLSTNSSKTKEEGVQLKSKKPSPYCTFTFVEGDGLYGTDVDAYPYAVLKVKMDRAPGETDENFIGFNVNGMKINDEDYLDVSYAATTDWQLVTLDLSGQQLGNLENFKLFLMKKIDESAHITFLYEYIAFFKSTAEIDVLQNSFGGDLAAYIAAGGEVATETPSEPTPAPTANFSMDYIQGAAPVLVNDTDRSVAKLTINEGDKVTILGWALTSAGLSDVKYSVDGSAKESFTSTRERPDVLTHLNYTGTVAAASKVGIGTDASHAEINTSALNAGSHEIKFYAYTNDGVEIEYYTINLTVEAKVQEPNTGDFGLIALAFAAVSTIVVKKKKNEI
ncbi:MAG: hypothetical protein E7385_07845 [Ruminococcaceae bacterium]|nr:hypothetical protein [Oscillospiraceae bacterium]